MKLTVFEISTLGYAVRANSRSYFVKDLRLIKKVAEKIASLIPAQPERPALVDPKKPTEEEIAAFEVYGKSMEAYQEQEVEAEFNNAEMLVIKQQLSGFNQFVNDDSIRDKIIALADKFGV